MWLVLTECDIRPSHSCHRMCKLLLLFERQIVAHCGGDGVIGLWSSWPQRISRQEAAQEYS